MAVKPMRKLLLALAVAVIIFIGLLMFGMTTNSDGSHSSSSLFSFGEVAPTELHGAYAITHIKDGDTLDIDIDGTETTIRLIGVDTPESVNPDESKNCEEGKVASQFTKDYLAKQEVVWIEYDKEAQDDYGRTLAYVYLDAEGKTRYQDILLENGMACCLRIDPNTKYANHFAELEQTAKKNGTGFWETDFWN